MKTQKSTKKICCIAICAFLLLCVVFWYISEPERMQKKELQELSQTQHGGIFCSMYPIGGYKAEDFTTYLGVPTLVSQDIFDELEHILDYVDVEITNNAEMTNVFLGLDPHRIEQEAVEKDCSLDEMLDETLLSYIESYKTVSFQIMLPYPSLDYWVSLEDDEVDERLNSYEKLVEKLSSYENVKCYFLGAEEWFIANPGNYVSGYEVNDVVSLKTLLYTFCDNAYQVSSDNVSEVVTSLSERIKLEKESPSVYPDLSELQIVFFGDSIIGNYPGSISVPGVVNGLAGAETYNYAIGGSSATDKADDETSFGDVVADFIEGSSNVSWGNENYVENPDKKLCFVIHYGLNDFFENRTIENQENAYDIDTYAGAMREGIRMLKENYPNAMILVVGSHPVYVSLEHDALQSEYIDALFVVSQEMSVGYLNNYAEIGWNEQVYKQYLPDGCHPNEAGRMIIGKQIIEALSSI